MSYAAQTDIEMRYGKANVTIWSDINRDGNATDMTARVTESLSVASEEWDDTMRATSLSANIPVVDQGGNMPVTVKDWVAWRAGLWLADTRGAMDTDREGNPQNRWMFIRTWLNEVKEDVRAGRRKLKV